MKSRFLAIAICFCLSLIVGSQSAVAQASEKPVIDLAKARITIDSLNRRGAALFEAGDSAGMYKMYAADADLGGIRGVQILEYWGSQIRQAAIEDRQKMSFETRSLSTDGEYLIEVGLYFIRGKSGDVKGNGKYLIVWKQEGGTWKLYRDIPL